MDYLSVTEFARLAGVNRATIRRAIERGDLKAIRPTRDFLVPRKALGTYAPRRGGRPLGSKDRLPRQRRWHRRPAS